MIGVLGNSARGAEAYLTRQTLEAAEAVGREIAAQGAVLVSGGGSGVMEAACRGVSQAGGLSVGILSGMDKATANRYVDIPIPTGIMLARNFLTIRASDSVIVVGGGVGTFNEVTHAVMEGRTPVVVLEGTGGWADRLRSISLDGKYLDERRAMELHYAETPHAAVQLAMQLGKDRHAGADHPLELAD